MGLQHVMTFLGWCLVALAVLQSGTCAECKSANGSFISDMGQLYDYLMEDYKTMIRPANHSRETVTVDLRLSNMKIDGLDEKNQVFTISGFMTQSWKDVRLVWSPEEFDGIDFTKIPVSELWYPDVSVVNSKNAYFAPSTHHRARITYHGSVLWVSPIEIETHCELDLSEFPFDEHVCKVVFISWSYDESGINLTSTDVVAGASWSVYVSRSIENLEWELKSITADRFPMQYSCCEEAYPAIIYSFTIRRRSTFATHIFVGPSVILSIVTPAVFLLPPGSGEKMMFGIGVLIADTLLLGELVQYIPSAHPNLPLIAKYFVSNIVMASLSLAISAVIVGFWDKSTSRLSGPPAFIRIIVLGPLATLLCVKKDDLFPTDEPSGEGALEINPEGEDGTETASGVDPETAKRRRFMANYLRNAARSEWRQLTVVFDRLFLVIYCVVLAILTLSFTRYL